VRAAFFVLLAVNVLFLAWGSWVDTPRQAKANDATSRLPRLQLVSELPAAERTAETGGETRKTALRGLAPVGPPSETPRCMSVGPFSDLTNAARAASVLRERGFSPQQRAEEGERWEGFWVSIGGIGSDPEATRVLRNLERNGITDAHTMPASDEGRRISVGLFSERGRAERRAQAVQKMGLKPEITERKQPGTVYWVDMSVRPGGATVPVQEIAPEGSGSRVSVQACPAGAGVLPAGASGHGDAGSSEPVPSDAQPAGANIPPTTVASAPKPR
jgi:hypothetical protein